MLTIFYKKYFVTIFLLVEVEPVALLCYFPDTADATCHHDATYHYCQHTSHHDKELDGVRPQHCLHASLTICGAIVSISLCVVKDTLFILLLLIYYRQDFGLRHQLLLGLKKKFTFRDKLVIGYEYIRD